MDYIYIYLDKRVHKMCLSKLVITNNQMESTHILKHFKSMTGFERVFKLRIMSGMCSTKNQTTKVTYYGV